MKNIRLKARAKINLTLDVVGKREDGYHLLESVMQTVALYDGITIERIPEDEIIIEANLRWLPTDRRNLAYRAAELMRETYSITEGVKIQMDKRIPVAAGLAGGSADCAAVLVGMNRLFSLGVKKRELQRLGAILGSDIPYCIQRGTALAEGVGDVLTPIKKGCPMCYVVLAKLPVSMSTAVVYGGLQLDETIVHPDTKGMLAAMEAGDVQAMGRCLGNVLETVSIPMQPKIAQLKQEMIALGAEGALMSGSGPTVFGLFQEEAVAKKVATKIRRKFGLKEVFVTRIYH
ncbi:4-(cytidine 5'-diphospho)-2-C-methyl-D-erythritol kinase [Chakrabartyella piscis]|uniref:4-(cytidine 5'-diphospho)-2-C-methyl-D-erythritol kinase n=1 Tax=Chakrabartyella piscis TaxID=2918914 RepID=UPI002958A112|nr:4-(cytidine 5'-diphospho)-2-C-methyl-D-erythritol kinase [Chakrabartyella piscis]